MALRAREAALSDHATDASIHFQKKPIGEPFASSAGTSPAQRVAGGSRSGDRGRALTLEDGRGHEISLAALEGEGVSEVADIARDHDRDAGVSAGRMAAARAAIRKGAGVCE